MQSLVLEYHDVYEGVDPDASGFRGSGPASYKLSAPTFRQHVEAIRARGLAAAVAPEWLAQGGTGRPLFLTFDDGGRGAADVAADVLEACGWRGHFFLTAGAIGTPGFLNASALRKLHERGHVIGTHSYSHPTRMGALPREEILREWTTSRKVIEDHLGAAVVTGSVPGGYYTRSVGDTADEAGLQVLFTSMPRTEVTAVGSCRIFGRYTIRRWTSPQSAAQIAEGAAGPRLAQWAIYSALNTLRSLAGDHYTTLRQWYWSTKKAPDRRD